MGAVIFHRCVRIRVTNPLACSQRLLPGGKSLAFFVKIGFFPDIVISNAVAADDILITVITASATVHRFHHLDIISLGHMRVVKASTQVLSGKRRSVGDRYIAHLQEQRPLIGLWCLLCPVRH